MVSCARERDDFQSKLKKHNGAFAPLCAGEAPALQSDFGLLFFVAAEVPAGWVAGVREECVCAGTVDVAVVLDLELVVLLSDDEIVLDGDGGVRILAEVQGSGIAEVDE